MRKSGLRDPFSAIEDTLDFTEYLEPYEDFQKEYKDVLYLMRNRLEKKVAYTVTYTDDATLFFIAFVPNRYKAKGTATMYFRDNYHPDFSGQKWRTEKFTKARARRFPPFDKYASDGKVPIPELMRYFNISFPCSFCGKHDFTLQSYEAKTCHIIEGEGDLNVFTRGYIACNDCFKKLQDSYLASNP